MISKTFLAVTKLLPFSLLLILAIGCSQNAETIQTASNDHHGQHGGHLIHVAGEAGVDLEFALNEKRRQMVIYIQKAETHEPCPLATEKLNVEFQSGASKFETAFSSTPQPKETEGQSSRFTLSLDKLPQQLLASNQFLLKVWFTVNGETFTATIRHSNDHAHDYHH